MLAGLELPQLQLGRSTLSLSEGVGVPAWGGDLTWNFATGQKWGAGIADPTETHASTIYAPNAAGVYAPYAANVLTRTDLGLQTVPTRTNVCLQSQAFDVFATWGGVAGISAIAANQIAAPDGTTTADKITLDGTSAFHSLSQTLTGTVAVYTFSVYAKAGSNRYIQLRFSAALGSSVAANFDLTGGVAQASATAPTSQSISAVGNGWYLCSMTSTLAAASGAITVGAVSSLSATSAEVTTLSGDFYVWQAQLELGSFATPPIPTTTGSATVNGNQQVIDLTGRLGTGVAGIWQGTILNPSGGAVDPYVFEVNDGSANNEFSLRNNSTNFRAGCLAGGVAQAGINVAPWQTGLVTIAFAVSTNFLDFRVVGQADPGADTVVTYPSGMNQLRIGGVGVSATSNIYQFSRKLALSFGAQDQTTFDAMYARAVLAAAA